MSRQKQPAPLPGPRPSGAQFVIDGLYYKFGWRGQPFKYIDGEWTRSNKCPSELHSADPLPPA